MNVLENMALGGMTKWIRISLNPSSWFANQFVDFYNETYEKNYHFRSQQQAYGVLWNVSVTTWMTLDLFIS